jgi:hypothetical protein
MAARLGPEGGAVKRKRGKRVENNPEQLLLSTAFFSNGTAGELSVAKLAAGLPILERLGRQLAQGDDRIELLP